MTLRVVRLVILLLIAAASGWVLHDVTITDHASDSTSGLQAESVPSPGALHSGNEADTQWAQIPAESGAVSMTADADPAITVYEERNQAVVNITTETVAYNWFLEPIPQEGSTGSGSIIDDRGYVLTNYHVVEGASRVFVTLADGDQLAGEVIGTDAENDLAVIKFDPMDRALDTIPMGDSDELRVGQRVMAIGNPFGLDRTLTTGIVSGLGRPLRARNDLVIRDMIQTDASINPGNSGGPLLDTQGRMIGIATMIFSPSGGSVGIGFAVPVNTARRVVPDLIEYGVVQRGWIDIIPRPLFPRLVEYAGLPLDTGLLVSEVVPDGNAEEAGLRGGDRSRAVRYGRTVIYLGGDIITAVDGVQVASIANLYEALEDKRPGEIVTVEYTRGRRQLETEIRLSERPEQFQWD
jgi:S1-C subfamily serine protease